MATSVQDKSKDLDSLKKLEYILRTNHRIDFTLLEQIYWRSPAWLVSKLQLFPGPELGNKLSNLAYQLQEYCSGRAIDIEDFYLNIGVAQADLTYTMGDKLLLVDVTTTESQSLVDRKRQKLKDSTSHLECEVDVIVIQKTHSFVHLPEWRQPIDLWDKFNQMIVSLDPPEQQAFVTAMKQVVVPSIKKSIINKVVEGSASSPPETLSGTLNTSFSQHPVSWAQEDHALILAMERVLPLVKVHKLRSPVVVPLPLEPVASVERFTVHPDPLVTLLSVFASGMVLPREVAVKLTFKAGLRVDIISDSPSETHSLFRYHGQGAVRAQRDALDDAEDKVMYACFSEENVVSSSGVSAPKGFSVAVGRWWSGYGAEHMTRGYGKSKTETTVASESVPLTVEEVERAQEQHDLLVNFLSSQATGYEPPLSKKVVAASKLTESLDWAAMLAGGLGSGFNLLKSNLMSLLGYQYEIARVITAVLSEKRTKFRYRVCFPSGSSHMLAVGTGNGISRMRDVPVAMWCSKELSHQAVPRSRSRTISLSSRLLGWWLKLPFVCLSRSVCAVQHNLPLPPDNPISDQGRSVVEHITMHLGTRQQESLLQDQTRYVLAGLYSYEPERIGPLAKVEGVLLHSPSLVVYWARLCRLQTLSFLTKSGMKPTLELSANSPPMVVPPQHSTPLTTFGMFVDAMFDSKLFNKDQDYKTASQALDWLGLLENEIKYRDAITTNRLLLFGGTENLETLVKQCISVSSIAPILADVVKPDSTWVHSATAAWDELVGAKLSLDFSWNAAAMYALGAEYFHGRRLTSNLYDYYGHFADLGDQSLTSFLSSSGSTEKGEATTNRQSVRKSTAMLGFLADALSNEDIPYSEVGTWIHQKSLSTPNQYQSLLVAGLNVMRKNGGCPLVSRTETKEQSGGGREFSAMNAVGIVACRLTERVFASYLPQLPTDRMTDPQAEATLCHVAQSHTGNRRFCVAADNSRFGPNQVMAKSRSLIAMLCLQDLSQHFSSDTNVLLYDLLSESTRLMQTKVSKMPQDLMEFIKEQGGLLAVEKQNPESALGRCATIMLRKLGWEALKPGFKQEWGMYQGALGMLSSCASTMLHDVFTTTLKEARIVDSALSLVTNDDSAIFITGVSDSLSMRDASSSIKLSLKYVLGLGGQVLNPFKTVVSSHLSEFHSTFATHEGLIAPELKLLAASLTAGRGEVISDDAMAPIESGISILRQGASLYTATSLSIFNSILFCDQYNRWPSLKRHGPRPAALGGPVWIDLVKELLLPGYGNLSLLTPMLSKHRSEDVAHMIASGVVAQTESGLLELIQAGSVMVTRRIYKQSRGNKEVLWTKPVLSLPLSGPPALAPLVTSVTSGLLRNNEEQGQDRLLVRMGRNAVNRTYKNIKVSEHHWLSKHVGSSLLSYDDLDSVNLEEINLEPFSPAPGNKYSNFVDVFKYWLLAAKVAKSLPPTTKLLTRTQPMTGKEMLVKPITIREDRRMPSSWSLHTAIRQWGTDELKLELLLSERLNFSAFRFTENLEQEARTVSATSMAFSKLAKQRTGPFMVPEPLFNKTSNAEACYMLTRHFFRGLSTVAPQLETIIASIDESMAPPPELLTPDREVTVWDVVEGAKTGKAIPSSSVRLEPGSLEELLKLSDSGWFTMAQGRYKVKRLARRRKQYGRVKWDVAFLITKQSSSYDHFVLGIAKDEDPSSFEGWPHYLRVKLPQKVSFLDSARLSSRDRLVFLSMTSFSSAAIIVEGAAVVVKLPLFSFGLRRLKPQVEPMTVVHRPGQPTIADWKVFLSAGEIRYSDQQADDDHLPIQQEVSRLTKQYHTHDLLESWRRGHPVKPVNVLNLQDWTISAQALYGNMSDLPELEQPDLMTWDDIDDRAWAEDYEINEEQEEEPEEDPEEEFRRTLMELGLGRMGEIFQEEQALLAGTVMTVNETLDAGLAVLFDIMGDDL